MDRAEALKLARQFGRVIADEFAVTELWLYGSWAYGEPTEASDIDLAVRLADTPTDLLASEKRLFRLRRSIDTRIEPVIIDPASDPSGFAEMVRSRGVLVMGSVPA